MSVLCNALNAAWINGNVAVKYKYCMDVAREKTSVLAIINWMPFYRDAASCFHSQGDLMRFDPSRMFYSCSCMLDLYATKTK